MQKNVKDAKKLSPFIAPDCRTISNEEIRKSDLIEKRAAEIAMSFS